MSVWKERYALKPRTEGGEYARAAGMSNDLVYHHEHPHLAGRAHCHSRWQLDMTTLVETRPSEDRYCQGCRRKEYWTRAAADGEQPRKCSDG